MSFTICACGAYRSQHRLGSGQCYREPCTAPAMVGEGLWVVDGGSPINTFTLTGTRLYRQHSDGIWSRPKQPASEPTLRG